MKIQNTIYYKKNEDFTCNAIGYERLSSFYSKRKRIALISVSAVRNSLLKTFFGHFLIGIGILSFLFFESSPLFSEVTRKDSLARVLFREGEEYVLKGDTVRAIKAFRRAVLRDRKFARAYFRLSQIYLALGTLDDRVKARHYIDEAVRFDSKNVTYLHAQLQLLLRIRFYWTAKRVAKKLLKIDPTDAKAYFTLGLLSEKEWLKYEDMINPQLVGDEWIDLSFAGFAEKDLNKTLEFYRKAIKVNPRFTDGYYRIAFICYMRGLLDRMVDLLREALNMEPGNKDYHLFLGLAYHRMRRFDMALPEYERAKSLMQPDELALFESVDLISVPEDGKVYRHADADDKERIQYAFWKRKDPLFLTELNERKLEHYARIAFANLRFSSVWQGIEGWKTAHGQVHIRYGPPLGQFKTWPFIKAEMGTGNPVSFSQAVWHYPGFSLTFEDVNFDGIYTFYNRWQYNEIVKKQPERYDYVRPEDRFRVSCSFANFRDQEDRSVLEVYQSIPQIAEWSKGGRQGSPLKRGVFLFDHEWNEVRKNVVENPFLTQYDTTLWVGWSRMRVTPGEYHLVVEFLDEEEGRLGRWLKDVTIEVMEGRNLALSDPVLAWEIGEYREEGELRRGGMRIVPNTLESYSIPSSIPLYFEIYNLAYSPEGRTHYRLTFTVQSEERKGGIGRFFTRLLGRGKKSGQVVTSYEYQGDKRSEALYQNLTIQGALPLNYHISVEVEDLNTGKKAVKEKVVVLRELHLINVRF